MKPAARIQAAIEILEEILKGEQPGDTIVGDYFKARRFAGSKDRRHITTQVYDILRSRAKLSWLAEQAGLGLTARSFVICDCVLKELDIAQLFNGDTYGPTSLSEEESNILPVLAQFDLTDAPRAVQLEYPDWLEEDLATSLGSDLDACMNALNGEAPLDLRINTLHNDYLSAQDLLAQQNIETQTTTYSPLCLRSLKKVKLGGIKAYKEGLVDIQDEGSQLIALLTAPKGVELTMDFCAGAGGKTLALAAQMENQGNLYALDVAAKRLFKMRRRLERAGVTNVTLQPINGENDPWLKQFEGRVDRLLVDAPCSGVGAWRRAPESRWKLSPDLLEDMIGRQSRILKNAAHLVKSGGRLIYATCSLLKRENEDQVRRFLEENPDFFVQPIAKIWAENIQTPCPFDGDFMTMRPDLHQSDGFFCAVLEKR